MCMLMEESFLPFVSQGEEYHRLNPCVCFVIIHIWTYFGSLLSSFASFVFLIAASFLAVLLSASSAVSEFGICSGLGGGSACTSSGSVSSDTARKNWPIHTSQG